MLRKILADYKQRRRERRLLAMTPEDVFGTIYRHNKWGGKQSMSGKGSDLDQTAHLIESLPILLRQYEVGSILDIPCGDFNWMQHVDLSGVHYIGADIVPEIIANNQKYEKDGIDFQVLNLTEDPLPTVDLIHVRDCLVHLSFEHALAAIQNIKKSGSKWLLTTTFPNEIENEDIVTGQWRRLNLEKSPFDFPSQSAMLNEQYFEDNHDHNDKSLGLWRIADL